MARAKGRTPKRLPESVRLQPVTAGMFEEFREEMRASQAAHEKRMDAKFATLEGKFAMLEGKFATLEGKFATLEAKFDAFRSDFHRFGVMLEEQHARNAVIFEALQAVIERQDRVERRLDDVENTVRSLAARR